MRRKVIKQAGQAYTITLPIQWVRDFGVDKKQEVDVEQSANQLIISAQMSAKGQSATIDATNYTKRILYQTIYALYAKGVDEIRVKCEQHVTPTLRESVHHMISFAVFEEKDAYVLKELGKSTTEQVDDLYKQVWQLIMHYYQSAITDCCKDQSATIEELDSRDREINKFCLHLQRLVSKQAHNNQQQGQILAQYAFMLEIMSDDVNRIWRFSVQSKKNAKPIEKILELSLHCMQEAFHISYNPIAQRIEALRKSRDELRALTLKINKAPFTQLSHYALNIAERSADLSQLAIMRKFKSE